MPVPTRAAATPMAIAQPNCATSGIGTAGRSGIASESVPSPVHCPRPMKMSVPMPAERRPGTSTTLIIGPAMPITSMSRKAPTTGEPSSVLTAAKEPAAPTTATACSGLPRRLTASTARPPPSAISGASGPRTTPRPRPASAARTMPGSSTGFGRPGWKPPAGEWPPVPGRKRIASPVNRPAIASTGTGHHAGMDPKPRAPGRSS